MLDRQTQGFLRLARTLTLFLALFGGYLTNATAQIDPPTFGYVVQLDARTVPDAVGHDGFLMRNARVRLKGAAGTQVRYFVQTEFLRSPAILDVRLSVALTEKLSVDGGLFKAPFSREFLIFRGDTPLAERSLVVNALAPRRQVGATLRYRSGSSLISAGIFNGNGGRTFTNDGEGYMGVARVEHVLGNPNSERTRVGVNGAFSRDHNAPVGVYRDFGGDRLLVGADIEITDGPYYGLLEVIGARLDRGATGGSTEKPWGFFLVSGASSIQGHRLVGRIEYYDPDHGDLDGQWLAGTAYPYSINRYARAIFDARVPLDTPEDFQLILRLQMALR